LLSRLQVRLTIQQHREVVRARTKAVPLQVLAIGYMRSANNYVDGFRFIANPRLMPELDNAQTSSVPILMYHRIANDGPPGLKRWRVAPELFDAHMNALHRAGYQTITFAEWADAIVQQRPVRGERVLLTFDDGYSDFLSDAIPVLRRHDFSATVFLVAERIGQTALWDAEYGDPAPLMSWEEIKSLQASGIEFGAHSCIHRKMTEMDPTELAEDTKRTRAILEESLGVPVPTLAYPYGDQNASVRRVVGAAGTTAAVTTEPGISKLGDDLLRLPRVEIDGDCTPERLISLLKPAG
jgi:peptidoglycan/xylan/chitin deacetylase (PgdA/CDA1 family)